MLCYKNYLLEGVVASIQSKKPSIIFFYKIFLIRKEKVHPFVLLSVERDQGQVPNFTSINELTAWARNLFSPKTFTSNILFDCFLSPKLMVYY